MVHIPIRFCTIVSAWFLFEDFFGFGAQCIVVFLCFSAFLLVQEQLSEVRSVRFDAELELSLGFELFLQSFLHLHLFLEGFFEVFFVRLLPFRIVPVVFLFGRFRALAFCLDVLFPPIGFDAQPVLLQVAFDVVDGHSVHVHALQDPFGGGFVRTAQSFHRFHEPIVEFRRPTQPQLVVPVRFGTASVALHVVRPSWALVRPFFASFSLLSFPARLRIAQQLPQQLFGVFVLVLSSIQMERLLHRPKCAQFFQHAFAVSSFHRATVHRHESQPHTVHREPKRKPSIGGTRNRSLSNETMKGKDPPFPVERKKRETNTLSSNALHP